ncbi:hypothetical protein [Pontibacter litorisediminis]|uniref:hypothetical protein n=1 Tax=Pontibacter litorisediminis TaxID=1846260 RepID=UPI0023EB909E|nr:hypothetical protein [Pontibacter litorisediminis]
MSTKIIPCLLSLLLCLHLLPVRAQEQHVYKNAVTVKLFGLSAHLRQSQNPEIFPNRLDERGVLVLNLGAIVGYERFVLRDRISVRVEQGLYADCAAELAGFSHIGFRGVLLHKGRHSVNGGFGPTLVYRKDWNRIEGYGDDGYFNRYGQWQYRFYWYGGEFEYNYRFKPDTELSVNLVPGVPELVSVGFGLRKLF